MRGGTSRSFRSPSDRAGISTFEANVAIGYLLNPDCQTFLTGSTVSVALNAVWQLGGPPGSTVSLTPGFRTELGNDWYALAGLDVLLAAPRAYQEHVMVWLMKAW